MRDLVERALVGTGSLSDPASTWPEVDALVQAQGELSPEKRLLFAAGIASVYGRAGYLPPTVPEVAMRAPAETLPSCGERVRDAVTTMLRGEYTDVLPEAVEILTKSRQRIPFELLPEFLARLPKDLQPQARAVVGERGRWLAAQKPEWGWVLAPDEAAAALPADADRVWSEGSGAERKALYRLGRSLEPERARAWLASSWKQDAAELRTEFVQAHEVALIPADETFLVDALKDRSAGVRVAAARMLWRLPGSELAQRLRQRAAEFLSKGKSAKEIAVKLPPDVYDKAWEREGVVESPPEKMGRRQWWLLQTLASVNPTHWETHLGMTPDALLSAALKHEHADVLIDAWTFAALRDCATDWMAPLWEATQSRAVRFILSEEPVSELLLRLSPAERDRAVMDMLRARKFDTSVFNSLPRPWPAPVADAFFSMFSSEPTNTIYSQGWLGWLTTAATALPASHLDRTLTLLPPTKESSDWTRNHVERGVDAFHSTLQFRRTLHQEMTP